jgi:hypothetical protein
MRGPLESLVAQTQQQLIQKRFPHRFLPSTRATQWDACGLPDGRASVEMLMSVQLALGKALNVCLFSGRKAPEVAFGRGRYPNG